MSTNGLSSIACAVPSRSLIELVSLQSPTLCSFEEAGWRFDYYFHPKGEKALLVSFPAALEPSKRQVPVFHRWSWAERFSGFDVLYLSDPTLYLNDQMLGGWMQGSADDWVLMRCMRHIKQVQDLLSYRNIVFSGSSVGGFLALQAATLTRSVGINVGMGGAYAENPQVSLLKYQWSSHIDRLANVCFQRPTITAVPQDYLPRLDVVTLMEREQHIPHGIVIVKESDTHHHQVQVQYLLDSGCAGEGTCLGIEVIPMAVDSTGHTPLTFQEMAVRLERLLDSERP